MEKALNRVTVSPEKKGVIKMIIDHLRKDLKDLTLKRGAVDREIHELEEKTLQALKKQEEINQEIMQLSNEMEEYKALKRGG